MEPIDVLRGIHALSSLTDDDLNVLLGAIQIDDFEDGHTFIREGARGDTAFVLFSGQVTVTHERDGKVVELNRLERGSLFGLLALVDDEPRSATCRAVGPVRVGMLPQSAFVLLFNAYAPIAFALQRALAEQIAHDFRQLDNRLREARG
ncbi:MAG: cyclic nucleotide-binding domain-containing protein [Deltaproteobacteria bacterium]